MPRARKPKRAGSRNSALPIEIATASYREAGLSYYFKPHTTTHYQWYCVLHGAVDMIIDGTPHALRSQDSILVPPGVVRSPRSRGKAPGYLFVMFDDVRLRPDDLTGRLLRMPEPLKHDLLCLVDELREPGSDSADLAAALVVRLLVGLRRDLAAHGKDDASALNTGAHRKIIADVDAFLDKRLADPIAREDVARSLGFSESHLARLYRTCTGRTIIQRLNELRVARAKELLLETDTPISEVALEVGYNSFSHFGKTFKRHVGTTPSDYRRVEGHVWR